MSKIEYEEVLPIIQELSQQVEKPSLYEMVNLLLFLCLLFSLPNIKSQIKNQQPNSLVVQKRVLDPPNQGHSMFSCMQLFDRLFYNGFARAHEISSHVPNFYFLSGFLLRFSLTVIQFCAERQLLGCQARSLCGCIYRLVMYQRSFNCVFLVQSLSLCFQCLNIESPA